MRITDAQLARSLSTALCMSGYCSFTASARPSSATARCTWPSEAAAAGLQLEAAEARPPVGAQLGGHAPAHERWRPSAARWSAARPAPGRARAAAGRARWSPSGPTFISGPLSRPSASLTAGRCARRPRRRRTGGWRRSPPPPRARADPASRATRPVRRSRSGSAGIGGCVPPSSAAVEATLRERGEERGVGTHGSPHPSRTASACALREEERRSSNSNQRLELVHQPLQPRAAAAQKALSRGSRPNGASAST